MPQDQPVLKPGTSNQTVRLFAHLNTSRHYRDKAGLFAMEGARLVRDAIGSGVRLHAVLLTEHARQTLGDALAAAAPNVRRLLISEALAKEIADTENAQGVFAIGEMRAEAPLDLHPGRRYLCLHSLQDPANLGAILRTAEALGTDGVILYHCVDLYNPKTLRSSMGALFRLPVTRIGDDLAFLAECASAGIATCAAVVDRDAALLGQFDFAAGGCVLIGNEGNGLPRTVSDACTHRLTIPMGAGSNSLNAAMAAGIFLWEMFRAQDHTQKQTELQTQNNTQNFPQ